MLLEKIYLLEEYAGTGLGTQSLKLITAYARSLGKIVLWLDTMKKGRALSFYQEFGFQIVGEKELEFERVLENEKPMYILLYKLN